MVKPVRRGHQGRDRVAADYFSDHVAHMCMEPMNVTVKAENRVIDVWSGNHRGAR
jgi:hypothetical protein